MNPRPKTIQIFLPGGDPQGIRIAELTTRIVQVIEVPRSLLQDFLKMPESGQVALYLLFGDVEDGTEPKVYIGQTGELRDRLAKHNKEKDFWQRALVLISRTNSLTQTHGLFLEWHSIQATKKADRYTAVNANNGSKPYTPAPLEADCLEIFETGQTLLATLGFPVFDPIAKPISSVAEAAELFHLSISGTDGRLLYTSEGFVVLKGSRGLKRGLSATGNKFDRARSKLIEAGVMHVDGETVVFDKDHLFTSPSTAAEALLGRASNGWVDWKSEGGETLHHVKRVIPDGHS